LFLNLSFEELVNITEPQLEHLNITKVKMRTEASKNSPGFTIEHFEGHWKITVLQL
jgi:chromosome segregation and condensation protein ScpB